MLILLTGTQQVGKTRLLERAIAQAEEARLTCKGVVSPGIWEQDKDGSLEKLGIQAVLLPSHDAFIFAMRRDLSTNDSTECGQADSLGLIWRILDDSIDRANAHFDAIAKEGLGPKDVLIVDELGMLEFARGYGLTSAMRLLAEPTFAEGADASQATAIVIVRPSLIPEAKARFSHAWGEPLVIDLDSADDLPAIPLGLGAIELGEKSVGGEQFLGRAVFDDVAPIEDEHPIDQ